MPTWVQMNIQESWFDLNGDPLSGGVLKAYEPGGLTPVSIAIDSTGASPQASITLNAIGTYEVSGNEILPFIDRAHKWGIFANATDAAADTPFLYGPYDSVPVIGAAESQRLDNLDVDDFTELRGITSSQLTDGDTINVIGHPFVVDTGTVTDNGGSRIVFNDDSNRYAYSANSEKTYIELFGAVGDGTTDDAAALIAADTFAQDVGGLDIVLNPEKTYAIGSAVTVGSNGQETYFVSGGKNSATVKALSAFTGGCFIIVSGGLKNIRGQGFDKDTSGHVFITLGTASVTNPLVKIEDVLNLGGFYDFMKTIYEYDRGVFRRITSEVEVGHSVMDLQTGGGLAHAASPIFESVSVRNPDLTRTVGEAKKFGIILSRAESPKMSGLISNFDTGLMLNGQSREVSLENLIILDLRSTPANDLWQTAWAATTAYSLNDYRRPTAANANGHFYIVTTAGTSDGAEPTWPTSDSGTVADGTVTWTEVGESVCLAVGAEQQLDIQSCRFEDGICAVKNNSNCNTKISSSRLVGESMAFLNVTGSTSEMVWDNNLIAGDIELNSVIKFLGRNNNIQSETLGQVPSHERTSWTNANPAFASGNGPDFSATARAGATSQIFDDYAEGAYTPTATSLTEVGGSATIAGYYTKKGDEVYIYVSVTPVTNTSATANTTYFTLPFTAARNSTCQAVGAAATTSLGIGRVDASNERMYVPTWTTEAGEVIITATYIAD